MEVKEESGRREDGGRIGEVKKGKGRRKKKEGQKKR